MDPQNKLRRSEGGGGGGGGGGGDQSYKPPGPQLCPRCNSSNTKFCYYNNYSTSQPRYFCKGCRRYWTQGGTLRNVPVGGGCRKSKRPKVGPSSSAPPQQPPPVLPATLGPTSVAGPAVADINNNNNIVNNNDNNMVFGGVRESSDAGFFLSSLNFGPNLGLLHGFGLPNFQPNNHQLFQNMYSSIREIGSSSSSAVANVGDWNLSMVPPGGPPPPPPLPETNININNNSNNNSNINNNNDNNSNNDNQESNQWAEYMGNNGLDNP